MADIVPAYEAYRPTSRDTEVRLFTPSRQFLIGGRSYECTVTLDEYYDRQRHG